MRSQNNPQSGADRRALKIRPLKKRAPVSRLSLAARLFARARLAGARRIVLPESFEPRVLRAAARAEALKSRAAFCWATKARSAAMPAIAGSNCRRRSNSSARARRITRRCIAACASKRTFRPSRRARISPIRSSPVACWSRPATPTGWSPARRGRRPRFCVRRCESSACARTPNRFVFFCDGFSAPQIVRRLRAQHRPRPAQLAQSLCKPRPARAIWD